MDELEKLARAAGLDPDSSEYRLRQQLAEADDDLLERLVQMRKEKGLTQQVVADRMRRDKAAVSNFERLSADPHLSTIRRYAAAVGASIKHEVCDFDEISSSDYEHFGNRFQAVNARLQSWPSGADAQITWQLDAGLTTSNVIDIARHRDRRSRWRLTQPRVAVGGRNG